MEKNKYLKRFIIKIHLYKLVSKMGFIFPFIAIMFDLNNLSATQIALCMMASKVAQMITEIPSGVIADKYSRRNVIIVSQFFAVIAYIFWIFMPYFYGYLLGYICFGFGMSLSSGCEEAFLFDELKKYDERRLYEKVLGKGGAFESVGILTASFVASPLIKLGFNFNDLMFITIIATLVSILFLFTIKPAKKFIDSEEPENILNYIQILKKGLKYSYRHTTALKLILFIAFSRFINVGFLEYSEIFYNELTNDLSKVSIIFGIMEIMYIVGNLSGFFWKKFFVRFLIIFYLITACLDIVAFNLYTFPISLLIVLFNSMVVSGIDLTTSAKLNDFIPSRTRATILSVRGFIKSLGTLVSLFFFGKVVDHFESYRMGFLTFACLFAIGSAIFAIIFWMDRHLRKKEKRLKLFNT